MRYSKLTVKCNRNFLQDIGNFIEGMDDPAYSLYFRDFLLETKMAAQQALSEAEKRDANNRDSAQFCITCPLVVRDEVTTLLGTLAPDCGDIYYMFEQIAGLTDRHFHQ